MIAGPGVHICDSCINVCKSILDKELGLSPTLADVKERIELLRQLLKNNEITQENYKARLDKLVQQV